MVTRPRLTTLNRARASGLVIAAVLLASATAGAKERTRYIYRISNVSAADGVKAPLGEIRAGLAAGIAKTAAIAADLPVGAPDPQSKPAAFKKFLKRKNMRAFKVNLEVTEYSREVETTDAAGHKSLTVRVKVRLFGETIPDRVMAFAGDGSAAVKMEVGKKVRPADDKAANHDAIEVAIEEAIGESLRKLAQPPPSKRKRKRKK